MTPLHWLLYAALPAIAASLLLVAVGGPRLIGLALAIGVLAPFALLKSLPPWPWVLLRTGGSGGDWLLWAIVAAGLLGTLHDLRIWPRPLGMPPAIALLLATPWMVLARFRAEWSLEAAAAHLSMAWVLFGVVWLALRDAVGNGGGARWVLPAALLCLLGDFLVLLCGGAHASLFALLGAAVVLLVALVTAAWRRPFQFGEGACLPIAIVHCGALVLAYCERRVPWNAALLAMLAPAPIWLVSRQVAGRDRSYGNATYFWLGLGAVAAFEAVAFVLAYR